MSTRLAIVVPEFPGGPGIWTLLRARNLAQAGIEVGVFFFDHAGPAALRAIVGQNVRVVRLPRSRSILLESLELWWRSLSPGRLRTALKYGRTAAGQGHSVRELLGLLWSVHALVYWRPDVVHVDTSYLAFRLLTALEPLACPVVISLRGADVDEKPVSSEKWRQWFVDAKNTPWLQFHCVSQHVLRRAVRLGVPESRCHLVYQGVQRRFSRSFEGTRTARLDRLLVVARLAPEKGLDIAIRALAILHQRGEDVSLEIIGKGPQLSELERLAFDLGIDQRVRFRGQQDHSWVQGLLERKRGRAIVVQPSRHEAFGQAVLEAMSLELPVVAARVGGIPELIEDGRTGLLHIPESAEDLADKIQMLLQNPDLARALAASARERAADFSAERETSGFLRLLESLD